MCRQPSSQRMLNLSRRFNLLSITGLCLLIVKPWIIATPGVTKLFVNGIDSSKTSHHHTIDSRRRRLTEKPFVYTFFQGVSNRTSNTGMTQETDEKLLHTWREEWARNGWNPVVVSLDEAKKHKDFEAINALLDGGPFGEYDRFCFLRWLALASVGGGFAADYDTFPLNFVSHSLPNDGKLTIHEESGDGGVPSIVSGTAEEYTRFAWLLARNAATHKSETHWSDMKAMQDVYKSSKAEKVYHMEGNVINGLDVLTGGAVDEATCQLVGKKKAIHFSHYSIQFGKVPPGSTAQDRESIGKEWLKDWWKICNKSEPPTIPEAVKAPIRTKGDPQTSEGKTGIETPQSKESDGSTGQASRPVIYTFVGHTDASKLEREQQAMLKVWLRSWYEIGWEPQVLFYDAASKHTEYAKLYNELTSISKTVSPQVYIRYLAMASVGGGWLSDFDLIPLSNFAERLLPNGGKFTIHESTNVGSGVPSLVSGSAEEYSRLSLQIVENAKKHGDAPLWNDVQSLQEIHQTSNGAAYAVAANVMPGQQVLQGRSVDRWTCTLLEAKYAVHVSQESIQKDMSRSTTAREWVLSWRRKCLKDEIIPAIQ